MQNFNKLLNKTTIFKSLSNNIKYLFFIIVLLITFSQNIYAQKYELSTSNKKAIKYYNEAVSHYKYDDFEEVINLLNKSLKYDNNFIEAWLLLGDSYSEVDSVVDAILSYETAISIDSVFFPSIFYLLGNLNYEIGEYQKAVDNYMTLSRLPGIPKEVLMLTYSRLIFASKAAWLVENPVSVVMQNIEFPINTDNDEYINYINPIGDYMMLTRRTMLSNLFDGRKPRYKEELMYSHTTDSSWDNPELVSLPWKNDLDMGSLNLSTNGSSMYFTGCYWPIGYGSCDIYVSHNIGSKWLEPSNLGSSVNTNKWDSQPIISSDNKKLYFASKRPGGKGGSDIWMSIKLDNNRWSPPINLGDSINTPKDEMSPFLHADGSTLYFSSTGHPGLGGYDLFISRQDELGRWSLAKNIGYPTNSRFDDINIFVSIDGKRSWLSSDRENGNGNMDIYNFNNYPEILPQKVMYIEGTVVDKANLEPIKAKIEITNLGTSESVNTTFSDSVTGSFLIVVYPGVDYAFNISKKGYLFLSENINIVDSFYSEVIRQDFKLSPVSKGNKLTMNNINFEFNEFTLLPSSFIELDKLVELLNNNPKSKIEIIGHTDDRGDAEYNMSLSVKRAESVGKYLINNGIGLERLMFSGMGADMPVVSNDSEEGRAINRRTEIRIR